MGKKADKAKEITETVTTVATSVAAIGGIILSAMGKKGK